MKANVVLGAVFAVMIVVLTTAVLTRQSSSSLPVAETSSTSTITATSTSENATTSTNTSSKTSSYTLAQVAQHNDASSCWSAINGNVYDLTNWIDQHPGGPEHILAICGTDGSAAFNAQHAGQAQPAQELQRFYIGTLAQ